MSAYLKDAQKSQEIMRRLMDLVSRNKGAYIRYSNPDYDSGASSKLNRGRGQRGKKEKGVSVWDLKDARYGAKLDYRQLADNALKYKDFFREEFPDGNYEGFSNISAPTHAVVYAGNPLMDGQSEEMGDDGEPLLGSDKKELARFPMADMDELEKYAQDEAFLKALGAGK